MVAKIRVLLLRRSIKRCERYGLLVLEKEYAKGAFDSVDGLLSLLASSGHLHNGDGTMRRLALIRKVERGSANIARLLRQAAGFVSYLKGERPRVTP